MRRLGLVLLGLLVACLQLSLHGFSLYGVVPNVALVILVIVVAHYAFADILWFALPLGLVLEVGSGLAFGTQLLAVVIFVLATKLLLRATPDRPHGLYLLGVLVSATIIINGIIILSLPFDTITANWSQLSLRTIVEALYNSVLLGVWLALARESQQKQPGYRLPTT